MAVYTDEQLVTKVRNSTIEDEIRLTDGKILEFASAWYGNVLSDGTLDLNAIIADAWEYLARDDVYQSAGVGAVTYSKPLARSNAAYYRALSASGGGGVSLIPNTLIRTDRFTPTAGNEFGA